MAGYFGKILNVDLTSHTIIEEDLDDSFYLEYLGGYGLAVRLLYERIPENADPLGPDNLLAFMPGLFTGSPIPFSGRYMVCTKSPLTQGWGDANSGGYFGPEIKRCGYDGIIFSGISKEPVYLVVEKGNARLESAEELWGLDAIETDLKLQEVHGRRVRVAAIGPAGENLLLNSGIVNDKGRIAARSGVGAVMGSKRLKALALIGNQKYPVANQKPLIELVKEYRENLKLDSTFGKTMLKSAPLLGGVMRKLKMPLFSTTSMATGYFHLYGTSFSTAISAEIGDAPIKNWDGVGYLDFPQNKVQPMSGKALIKWKVKPYGCFSCPVRCGAILSIPEIGIEETHRPEYETLIALGGLILNDNLMELFKINEWLNRMGWDTISAGGVVAFTIECFKNNLITKDDLDGLELDWGKADTILPLLEFILKREGLGDKLALGVKQAAQYIGNGAEQYAIHANGQELPMHDSRHGPSLGTTYISDPTPGRHTAGSIDFMEVGPLGKFLKGHKIPKSKRYDYHSKGAAQAAVVKLHQTLNSFGFCTFATWNGRMKLLEMCEQLTGLKFSIDDLVKIGFRIQTLRQLFNAKHHAIRHELSNRAIGIPPLQKGPLKNISLDLKQMVYDYYEHMDWDPVTGIPYNKTLQDLNLEFASDALNHAEFNQSIEVIPESSE